MTQHTLIAVLLLALTSPIFSQVSFADEWYVGGTLHKASPQQWRSATYKNRLATAGDWAAVMHKEKNLSMIALKGKAVEILFCVNEATEGESAALFSKVVEVAAFCHLLLESEN